MEKRALLAIVLSIAVLYIFSFLNPPETKNVPVQSKTATITPAPAITVPALQPTSDLKPTSTLNVAKQKDVTVDTDLYTAVFTSRGAALKSVTLKKYREQNTPTARPVTLGDASDPVVMTFMTRAPEFNLPEGAFFLADTNSVSVAGSDKKQLIFTYISDNGLSFRKVYSFTGDSYGIGLETQVINSGTISFTGTLQEVISYPAQLKPGESRYDASGSYLYSDNNLKHDKQKDIVNSPKIYNNNLLWAGFADKYFLTAILSENNSIASVELKKNQSGYLESIISSSRLSLPPGQSTVVTNQLFIGPKDIDILKAQGSALEQSLDLGWFSVIAKPLLYSLKFFYQYVGNYGVAIIIITIILKVIFFPLTYKSYQSMKEMQKIQPLMMALKEKHKNDRNEMNKAVMELYREHKVNPFGGCLPMLIQIPVFFALYKALMFSIELRHAPFFLWINDLSGPDNLFGELLGLPFVIGPLPLLMGASMFVQQKMTPSNMDPVQAKMMLILPIVFTFMFLNFPSGLVLYWLLNNVLTIGQQMYINKH